jgi:MerR family transcriptional regulator, light-induced transcriptional regulator
MDTQTFMTQDPYSISAVERDTGLSKDTLRVWEKRYGFPCPNRDQFGERVYPPEQVTRLRVLRRLLDVGHRPGKLMNQSTEDLCALLVDDQSETPSGSELSPLLEAIRSQNWETLQVRLGESLTQLGLARFLEEAIEPLDAWLAGAWIRGDLPPFSERLYRETVQNLLRGTLANLGREMHPPRILLSSFPDEADMLGPLIMEAALSLEGARCIALGPNVPISDIALAAKSQRADVVALWFSRSYPLNRAREGLQSLGSQLGPQSEIWVCSRQAALTRRGAGAVKSFNDLHKFSEAVRLWRQQHHS